MGFAGAAPSRMSILLAGLAGLLAGASSMAAGEYVSMKAQRELFERQIELEAAELAVTPEEELEELALIYRAKGIPADEARRIAQRLAQDPSVALDTLVREELGLDPGELGSPWGAAIGSFLAFAVGAFIPVDSVLLRRQRRADRAQLRPRAAWPPSPSAPRCRCLPAVMPSSAAADSF